MSMSLSLATVYSPLQEDSQFGNRAHPGYLKRKATCEQVGGELNDSITIRTCNDTQDRKVTPKQIICRSALPLAYLRPNLSTTEPQPYLFSACIQALEAQDQAEVPGNQVLIVQEVDKSLAAIERVSKGVYAICRLSEWVTLEDLNRKPAKRARTYDKSLQSLDCHSEWWSFAEVVQPTQPEDTSKKLLDLVLAGRPCSYGRSIGVPAPKKIAPLLVSPKAIPSTNTSQPLESDTIHWPTNLRQQYLETLYTSRAPLAYFIKGPLSRARVAHDNDGDSHVLAELLRTNILPVKFKSNAATIDKKYNKAILDLLSEMPPGVTAEFDVGAAIQEKIVKSKRRKRITSDGLLPGEEEYIVSWWIKREITSFNDGLEATHESKTKLAIMEQKMRETQCQIILILEILALERQIQAETDTSLEVPQTGEQDSTSISQEKKKQDLPRTLETLVEKLQIWETMSEDILMPSSSSKADVGGSCLRSFCMDVVLPFYSSRIPEISKCLCQKFGVATSPEKKLTRSISSSKAHVRPGEPLKDRRSHRPLERMLTTDKILKRKHPSLTRSATDSLVPSIKQELDDISMSNIPLQRASLLQSKMYARREVDLTAEVKATEARLKKKADVEQELRGAIFALQKPNARLAVKEFVDASDQRKVQSKSRSRKPQNPVRNPFAVGVQVTATPRVNRYGPRVGVNQSSNDIAIVVEPEIIPISSAPRIPASSVKQPTSRSGDAGGKLIAGTPSKGPRLRYRRSNTAGNKPGSSGSGMSKSLANMVDENDGLDSEPDLPVLVPPTNQFKRPGLPVARSSFSGQDTSAGVFSTPKKTTSDGYGEAVMNSSPLQGRKSTQTAPPAMVTKQKSQESSIYDALGWDNDFDDI